MSNICFTERVLENGSSLIDVLNVSSNGNRKEKYELIFKDGKKLSGSVLPCKIESFTYTKN